MIVEAIVLGLAFYARYRILYHDEIKIKNQWNNLMNVLKLKNNKEQSPEILKIINKKYGYDLIISIPIGFSFENIYKYYNEIKNLFGVPIRIQHYKNIAYIRLYTKQNQETQFINDWNTTMYNCNLYNKNHDTFNIIHLTPTSYGYNAIVKLASGFSYLQFENKLPEIENSLGAIIETEFDKFKKLIKMKIATNPFDENKQFKPIKLENSFLVYLGETYFHEPIIKNLSELPHIIIAGTTNSGKSRCLFGIITNLLYNFNEKQIELYLAQASSKKELQIFANYKQTKYFAHNLQMIDNLIQYLMQVLNERNKLFNELKVNNILEYNSKFPNGKLPNIFLVIDEFTSIMPGDSEIDPDYKIKKRIIFNLLTLMRECRSVGIFIIAALQRPDQKNMDVNIKNLFNIKIAFRANNLASAKVLTDDERPYKLPNREAIVIADDEKTLKTLYIDNQIIKTLLSKYYTDTPNYVKINTQPNNENKKQTKEKESEIKPKAKSKGEVVYVDNFAAKR